MIHKSVIFKRKFKTIFSIIFFSFLIFLGVLGICLGIWLVTSHAFRVVSPLGKMNVTTTSRTTTAIQNFCHSAHVSCSTVVYHTDSTATFTIDATEEVVISLKKDVASQLASLQVTMSHLTIEGKRFNRIDFRFDKPVISL